MQSLHKEWRNAQNVRGAFGLSQYLYTSVSDNIIEEHKRKNKGARSMRSSNLPKEFNQLILDAVDEALSILGDEPVRRAFYYHLEKRAHIKRDEVPCKLHAFHKVLTELFYDGSVILEKRISKVLCERMDLELPAEDRSTLADFIGEARQKHVTL